MVSSRQHDQHVATCRAQHCYPDPPCVCPTGINPLCWGSRLRCQSSARWAASKEEAKGGGVKTRTSVFRPLSGGVHFDARRGATFPVAVRFSEGPQDANRYGPLDGDCSETRAKGFSYTWNGLCSQSLGTPEVHHGLRRTYS